MIQEQITVPTWVSVKTETRHKLRQIFMIPMTGNTDVINDEMGRAKVVCDGHTNEDLKAITVEKLQDFLGSISVNESLHDLFTLAVEKVEASVEVKKKDDQREKDIARINELKEIMNNAMKEMDELVNKIKPAEIQTKDNPLKCLKCDFLTQSQFALRMHVAKKHKNK